MNGLHKFKLESVFDQVVQVDLRVGRQGWGWRGDVWTVLGLEPIEGELGTFQPQYFSPRGTL